MNERVEWNEEAARALRLLGRAPLPEGMAERVGAELQLRQRSLAQRTAAPVSLFLPGIYALTFLSLAFGTALWVNLHRNEPARTAQNTPSAQPHQANLAPPSPLAIATSHALRGQPAMRRVTEQPLAEGTPPEVMNPPPLPLSAQERLLLQLARSPEIARAPSPITRTEVLVNHGVGVNAIFELDHQIPSPLQSTLQTQPIQGDIE